MLVGSRRANVFPQEVLGALVKVKDIWGQSAHFFSLKTFRKHNELAVLLHSKRARGTRCLGETRRDGLALEGEVPQTQRALTSRAGLAGALRQFISGNSSSLSCLGFSHQRRVG